MRERRRTWTIGGIGLVACGVLVMLSSAVLGMSAGPALYVVSDVIYAAAILAFAIGTRPEASVVARRPLGITTMAIVAVWPLIDRLAVQLLPQDGSSLGAWTTYGYVTLLVQAGAALVAATQIARAGVVPHPWCWAPLWVLAFQAFAWAVPQIIAVWSAPARYRNGPTCTFYLARSAASREPWASAFWPSCLRRSSDPRASRSFARRDDAVTAIP